MCCCFPFFVCVCSNLSMLDWALLHTQSNVATAINLGADAVKLAISCEAAMFPFLFPQGTGWFDKASTTDTFVTYLRYRMSCLFSCYTLYKPYLLLMYQLRQAVVSANSLSQVALERDIVKYKRQHPGCTDQASLAFATCMACIVCGMLPIAPT